MTFKFLVGEFVHLSSLFELLYYIRSLRHQPLHEIFLALSTNTYSKYSGGTKYKYTLIRGSEHQIQIHIIQGVRAPNTNTHYSWVRAPIINTHFSGGPSTKYKYILFRGSKNQRKIHIIQGIQEPNKSTHFSGGPTPNTNTHYSGGPRTK